MARPEVIGAAELAAVVMAAGAGAAAAGAAIARKRRTPKAAKIELRGLVHPWWALASHAKDAAIRFDQLVRATPPGPLHDRLWDLNDHVCQAAEEAVRAALVGQSSTTAAARADVEARLHQLNGQLEDAVVRAAALSTRGHDASAGDVVGELEALRQGLDEAGGTSALPAP